MQTLYDLGLEIEHIREAVDSMTVTGNRNASLVVYIFGKCNELIQSINEISQQLNTPPEEENQDDDLYAERFGETDETIIVEEEGEMNGEQDSGPVT